jgi:hypothetical protein
MPSGRATPESRNQRAAVEWVWQKNARYNDIHPRCEPECIGRPLNTQWLKSHVRQVLSVRVPVVAFGLNEQNDGGFTAGTLSDTPSHGSLAWLQATFHDDELRNRLDTLTALEIGEDERSGPTHPQGVRFHHGEIGSD